MHILLRALAAFRAPLGVVLQYARCAGVPMEMIVDDSLDLPDKLSIGPQGQKGQRRSSKLNPRERQARRRP